MKSISIIILFIFLILLGDCDKPPTLCKCDNKQWEQNPADTTEWVHNRFFGDGYTIYNAPCDSDTQAPNLYPCYSLHYKQQTNCKTVTTNCREM